MHKNLIKNILTQNKNNSYDYSVKFCSQISMGGKKKLQKKRKR